MMPTLTIVSKALDLPFGGVSHVIDTVSEFLRPATLDKADSLSLMKNFKELPCSQTAMNRAVSKRDLEIIEWLLSTKGLTMKPKAMQVILKLAVRGDNATLISLILNLDNITSLTARYSIILGLLIKSASKTNKWESVKALRVCNQPFFIGRALAEAAKQNRLDVVSSLSEYAIDPEEIFSKTSHEQAAVIAAERGYCKIVELLYKYCCSMTRMGLMFAAIDNNQLEVIRLITPKSDTFVFSVSYSKAINSGTPEAAEAMLSSSTSHQRWSIRSQLTEALNSVVAHAEATT